MDFQVAKISTRGQVVIPQKIRDQLNIGPGARFIVEMDGDTITLTKLDYKKKEGIS